MSLEHKKDITKRMREQYRKQMISVCSICDMVYAPKELEGISREFIDADIKCFYEGKRIEDFYIISHGYCEEHYRKALAQFKKEINDIKNGSRK